MELAQVLRLRRSTRSYTAEQISEEQLDLLLAAAQSAPLAMGDHETTHITVLQDPLKLAAVRQACERRPRDGGPARDSFYGAQTVFFISATDISDDHIEYCNAACIIENIHLQATALGLGSVYIWGCLNKLRADAGALSLLGLPAGYELLSAIAVGHAAEALSERLPAARLSVNRV